jgi:hypothetical protein
MKLQLFWKKLQWISRVCFRYKAGAFPVLIADGKFLLPFWNINFGKIENNPLITNTSEIKYSLKSNIQLFRNLTQNPHCNFCAFIRYLKIHPLIQYLASNIYLRLFLAMETTVKLYQWWIETSEAWIRCRAVLPLSRNFSKICENYQEIVQMIYNRREMWTINRMSNYFPFIADGLFYTTIIRNLLSGEQSQDLITFIN